MNKALALVRALSIEDTRRRRTVLRQLAYDWLAIPIVETVKMPAYRLTVKLAKHIAKGI